MHQGKALPLEEVPVDPPNRQAPSFDDSPPERLSEAGYRLRARLGHGRLGSIYEAQDELSRISGSQHFAAVLLIDDRIASRPGFASDFERGAAELKSIAHPNIVKLLQYGRDSNRYYLVNELLESASLRFVLNDAGTLPPTETTAVLRAVGDALQYLHAKGIVHGNLRPENVLVTFGYEVKLLDIVPNGWLVNPTDALGVPARAPDKREDVFGLACLAYEMLSGRHPYNGNTAQEAHRAGLEAEPIENCTDRQWRALANALSVHRDDRTPSVAQFLEEFGVSAAQKLKSVVAAADVPPPAYVPPTYTAPDPPPAMARPVVAERAVRGAPERRGIVGTLVVALLVIGAGIAAWYYQDPLRTFATDLATEVEAQMARQSPSATADAPAASTTAPLEQAPAITDDTPATVLAPGAAVPEPREPVAPPPEAVASADTAAVQPAPATGSPRVAREVVTPPPPREQSALPPPREQVAQASPAPTPVAAAGPTSFAFQQGVVTVRESDVAARIVIRRSGSLAGAASVSWWTAEGTAQADADYADLGARIERFNSGEASRTVFVPLTNDAIGEPAKSFSVMLGAVEGGSTAGRASGEVRVDIVDDD
jgi:hypothetical protein